MEKKRHSRIKRLPLEACLVMGALLLTLPATAQAGKTPSPELVSMLTKELNVTPEQAAGGAGSLFKLAKTRMKPADFAKVASAVPGMDGLLKAAPSPGGTSPLGALPGKAGGMAGVTSSFKKLGLSPDMVGKFVPVLTDYVGAKGGANTASQLAGVLK